MQRQKDAGAYSVKAALERLDLYKTADPGWITILKQHYAAVAVVEYDAALQESRFVRWSAAARHAQHGHLRHARRDPPRPDPAVLRP